jgi:hypothetical protein
MPLLLLDHRNLPDTNEKGEVVSLDFAKNMLERVRKELVAAGTTNFHRVSIFAYLLQVVRQAERRWEKSGNGSTKKFLHEAIQTYDRSASTGAAKVMQALVGQRIKHLDVEATDSKKRTNSRRKTSTAGATLHLGMHAPNPIGLVTGIVSKEMQRTDTSNRLMTVEEASDFIKSNQNIIAFQFKIKSKQGHRKSKGVTTTTAITESKAVEMPKGKVMVYFQTKVEGAGGEGLQLEDDSEWCTMLKKNGKETANEVMQIFGRFARGIKPDSDMIHAQKLEGLLSKLQKCLSVSDLDHFLFSMSELMARMEFRQRKELLDDPPVGLEVRQVIHTDPLRTVSIPSGGSVPLSWKPYFRILKVIDEDDDLSKGDSSVAEIKDVLQEYMKKWVADLTDAHRSHDFTSGILDRKTVVAGHSLLACPEVHAQNLYDREEISKLIHNVAKIDRLPSANNIESLHIIRSCWDSVDIFIAKSAYNKVLSKTLYFLLLVVGVATTTMSIVRLNRPDIITEEVLQHSIMGLSLLGSLLASVLAYSKPVQRWQELRAAALTLESQVWQFRTRTGHYGLRTSDASSMGSNPRPERQLMAVQEKLIEQVSKAASVSETAMASRFELFRQPSKYNLKRYNHGQYRGAGIHGTFKSSNRDKLDTFGKRVVQLNDGTHQDTTDDHHSPIRAVEYLNLRVQPMVAFYQKRIPRYYNAKTVVEYMLLFGAFASTILAFLEMAAWASVGTAITGALTAWREFSEYEKKLIRYSNTVERMRGITVWWSQLSDVEQASSVNLNKLIFTCEDLIEREREAWKSTSGAAGLLASAVGDSGGASASNKDGRGGGSKVVPEGKAGEKE